MYQLEKSNKKLWQSQKVIPGFATSFNPRDVKAGVVLNWEEHNIECGPLDKAQDHFFYGIYPNPNFKGLFDFGADIYFKRGAKLEADLEQVNFGSSLFWHRFLQRIPFKKNSALYRIRRVRRFLGLVPPNYNNFVLECYAEENLNLILEGYGLDSDRKRKIKFRHSFPLVKGHNFFTTKVDRKFVPKVKPDEEFVCIYPDNDKDTRIIFTWLDFVNYKFDQPAEKVKCVAWDLDNVLWDGILAENKAEEIKLKPGVLETIKELDKRGIIQTIVSKNDHDVAFDIVKREGLQDYFIYPAINWGQKSENLKKIADKLNINPDTFALIDDSDFERLEVKNALPQVRTYLNHEGILQGKEFDVPITEASQLRRKSYLAEVAREKVSASYSGDYDDFLRSWEMQLELFIPTSESEVSRCLELIQRSNQLHLNGNRYDKEAFNNLLPFKCS